MTHSCIAITCETQSRLGDIGVKYEIYVDIGVKYVVWFEFEFGTNLTNRIIGILAGDPIPREYKLQAPGALRGQR